MDEKGIRERIEQVKEKNGVSTNRLAKESGVDAANLSRGLSGKISISRNVCEKIAKAWNVSFDWLLNDVGEMCGVSKSEGDQFLQQMQGEETFSCPLEEYIEMKGELTSLRAEVKTLKSVIAKQDKEIDFYRSLLRGKS